MKIFQKTVLHRIVSALLAIVMMVSLIPFDLLSVSAEAATITPPQKTNISQLDFCRGISGRYPSPNVKPNPQVHIFTVTEPKTAAGKPMVAFCLNHSAGLGSKVKSGWNLVGEKNMGAATPYLSWFYHEYDNAGWDPEQSEIANACFIRTLDDTCTKRTIPTMKYSIEAEDKSA